LNYKNIPRETTLQSPSAPLFYEGGTTGIVLLHGFTGVPGDLKYLAEVLNRGGFTVSVPRLPGHGTNTADFRTTGWREWLRRSIDEFLDLSYRCEKVYVAGLSMGGVLTLILASMFAVDRIALAAPAITTRNRTIRWTPILRFLVRHGAQRPEEKFEDPGYRALAPHYWKYDWIAQVASLRHLQKIALKRLRLVKSQTLTIVSQNDAAVPVEAADIIEHSITSERHERLTLTRSGHIVVNDVDREAVAQAILTWFQAP